MTSLAAGVQRKRRYAEEAWTLAPATAPWEVPPNQSPSAHLRAGEAPDGFGPASSSRILNFRRLQQHVSCPDAGERPDPTYLEHPWESWPRLYPARACGPGFFPARPSRTQSGHPETFGRDTPPRIEAPGTQTR